MKNSIYALLFIPFLAACGATLGVGSTVKAFVVSDLNNAEALARDNGDEVAALCYIELAKYAETKRGLVVPDGSGTFTVFQNARNIRRGVDAGIPEAINTRCAPLILDSAKTLFRIGRLVL